LAVRSVRTELTGGRNELAGSGQGDFVTVHVSPLLLLPLPVPASLYTDSAAHDLQTKRYCALTYHLLHNRTTEEQRRIYV
jgi:hypothetical protein